MAALIIAVPGFGPIRSLAHGSRWLALALCLRLASALPYVVVFRAVFAPGMSVRLSYRIEMSEIGLNGLVPGRRADRLALGDDWVLHRRGIPWDKLLHRSAAFLVLTSAFNVGAIAVLGLLAALGLKPLTDRSPYRPCRPWRRRSPSRLRTHSSHGSRDTRRSGASSASTASASPLPGAQARA